MENTNISSSYKKPYNLDPNIEAALSYLVAPFTGVLVYVFERENKFVRFHALQSILFGIASFVSSWVAGMLVAVLIGILLIPLVAIVSFVLWLVLMWKAYNNEEFALPFLCKIAHDQVNKTAK